MPQTETKAKTKTVFVVRKHITDWKTGAKIRHEDYPQRFALEQFAQDFLEEKKRKYSETVNAMIEDCPSDPGIEEGRQYEVIPIEVPA